MVSMEFFIDILPAALLILGLTQPITEMSTKGDRCLGLTTLPLSCADCHKIWEPQTSGTHRACPGLYRDCFTFFTIQQRE